MGNFTFEQLQSHLLRVGIENYGHTPFPRFYLLSKAQQRETRLLCGRKDFKDHSNCDGEECSKSTNSIVPICWRMNSIQQPELGTNCTWLRLEDAFFELWRCAKIESCSDSDMFRIAPRTSVVNGQRSLWDNVEEEASPAPRLDVMISRIVRDTPAAKALKKLYTDHCQVCGLTLQIGMTTYSEAHHLRPLGAPHDGPDVWSNMIVLCPNHHTLFDYGVPQWRNENTIEIEGISFNLKMKHPLDRTYIDYYQQHLQLKPED